MVIKEVFINTTDDFLTFCHNEARRSLSAMATSGLMIGIDTATVAKIVSEAAVHYLASLMASCQHFGQYEGEALVKAKEDFASGKVSIQITDEQLMYAGFLATAELITNARNARDPAAKCPHPCVTAGLWMDSVLGYTPDWIRADMDAAPEAQAQFEAAKAMGIPQGNA